MTLRNSQGGICDTFKCINRSDSKISCKKTLAAIQYVCDFNITYTFNKADNAFIVDQIEVEPVEK